MNEEITGDDAFQILADEIARGTGPHVENIYVNAEPLSAKQRAAVKDRPNWAARLDADRRFILESGVVPREAILDRLIDEATLKADPLWEKDPLTDDWHRK